MAEKMRVRFYGVRGSIPTPTPDTVRYGGNTPCVELIIPGVSDIFIIDAGTGIRELGNKLAAVKGRTINLFISHTHWDHIHGFPFFSPIFIPGYPIRVYGPNNPILDVSLEAALTTKQMEYAVFPVRDAELRAKLEFNPVQKEKWRIGEVEIESHPLSHPVIAFGYSFTHGGKRLVYQSDHEPFHYSDSQDKPISESERATVEETIATWNESIVEFSRGADLLIADSAYTPEEYEKKKGWGHSSTMHVLERAMAAGVKRLALFHHDPTHSDDMLEKMLADVKAEAARRGATCEIFLAREGEEIEL